MYICTFVGVTITRSSNGNSSKNKKDTRINRGVHR